MFEKKVLPIMVNEIKCLDKGFVRLLNISGAVPRKSELAFVGEGIRFINQPLDFCAIDTDPALVARTSFAKGLVEHTQEQDEQLVEYLIRNQHTAPLEFTTVYLEFKMPLFVARQVMRHRTASINEVSGRYVTLPKDWYIPEVVRGKHSGGNKQGSEDNLPEDKQETFKEVLNGHCLHGYNQYQAAINSGVCPEQARMLLSLNHYTQFVWKQDLHNLMHFLSLRLDEHAQWEVRQYADAIYKLLKNYLPKSMEWFDTYRRKLDTEEKATLVDLYGVLNRAREVSCEDLEVLAKLLKRQGLKL